MDMVRVQPERFPARMLKKLHAQKTGSCHIHRRISANAYELELPDDMRISPVFTIEDLTMYIV